MYLNTLDLSSKTDKQITPQNTLKLAIDSILESKTRIPSQNIDNLLNSIYTIVTVDNSDLVADTLQPVLEAYNNSELNFIYAWLYSRQETINELIISEFYDFDVTERLERDLETINWFLSNLSYQIPVSFNSLIQLSQILTF